MVKSRRTRELSRLELAALGLVLTGGPCTAYWVQRQFQESLSSFFSGSAGAVYPAIERLEQRGLIEGRTSRNGERVSRQYKLTAGGKKTLRRWLLPPLPAEDIAFTMDPVRTRIFSLSALSPSERLRFVDEALAKTRRRVEEVRDDTELLGQSGDLYSYLGGLGVLHEAEARVRWLEEVRAALQEEGGSDD